MSATRNTSWVTFEHGAVVARRDGGMDRGELADVLDEALAAGFDLTPGSAVEDLTVREFCGLVRAGQVTH